MSLTAVHSLLEKYEIDPRDIGRWGRQLLTYQEQTCVSCGLLPAARDVSRLLSAALFRHRQSSLLIVLPSGMLLAPWCPIFSQSAEMAPHKYRQGKSH